MEFTVTKLYYIPYVGVISGLVGILTSYAIAVARGDVEPWLPYIRRSGNKPIYSNICRFSCASEHFSRAITLAASVLQLSDKNNKTNLHANASGTPSSLFGQGGSVAHKLVVVGSLDLFVFYASWALTVFLPHMVGAILMFISLIGLMINLAACTTILDYPDWKQTNFFVRCASAAMGLLSGILTIAYCPFSQGDKLAPLPDRAREVTWASCSNRYGYVLAEFGLAAMSSLILRCEKHSSYPPGTLVSTISEWMVVATFLAFSLSFAAELRKFNLYLRLEYCDEKAAAPLPVK
ncbi:unnamed protein product, partial [Ixodes hexagonus]